MGHSKGSRKIIAGEKGKLIARAFQMKIEGLTNTEIASKLHHLGLRVDKKRMSGVSAIPSIADILPSFLDGQVINGKHEPLISEELFLRANDMLKRNAFGYKHTKDTDVPLKNFVKCADCDTPFTGYIVKKKNLYYYKCNRIGCRCNRSATAMHGLFAELLKSCEINRLYLYPLKGQFLHICEALNDSGKEDRLSVHENLHTLNTKLERLEERFAFGEIDREIFEKVGGKLKQEIKCINDDLKRMGIELSNPALLIDHSLEIISNLSDFWVSGHYDDKRKLQEVLFPGGVLFDKQSNNYRTQQVNSILQLTHSISTDLGGIKNGQIEKYLICPVW